MVGGDQSYLLERGVELPSALKMVKEKFALFGIGEVWSERILGNLSEEACLLFVQMNEIRSSTEGKNGFSMFDEEVAGAAFFVNNRELVGTILQIPRDEQESWCLTEALSALLSDCGKVVGDGGLTWLYKDFHLAGKKVATAFEHWQREDPKNRKNIKSHMQLPWSEAKELFKTVNLDKPDELQTWGENAKKFESEMARMGWDVSAENPSFHDVMTRSHLVGLSYYWSKIVGEKPGMAHIARIAPNHHLIRGFPPGEGSLWERTGITQAGEDLDRKTVRACLLLQVVDSITAALARTQRHENDFFTNAVSRMETELAGAVAVGRISPEEGLVLRAEMGRLPKDKIAETDSENPITHVLARILEEGHERIANAASQSLRLPLALQWAPQRRLYYSDQS